MLTGPEKRPFIVLDPARADLTRASSGSAVQVRGSYLYMTHILMMRCWWNVLDVSSPSRGP